MDSNISFFKKYKVELLIFFLALIFSTWLMFSTFSCHDGALLIAGKVWSDFSTQIPLLRSFSLGRNFPPEYPMFPGYPIQYHFAFYALAGFLERMGMRIDYALNLPSILGFVSLIMIVYIIANKLFKSTAVGLLSILFLIFNGTLNFVYYFIHYPFLKYSLLNIFTNSNFISFGPFDKNTIGSFWPLNIYTNQRHLALSYALSLFLIYVLIKPYLENRKLTIKIASMVGVIFGLSFLLNMAVFLMTTIVISTLFLFLNKNRNPLLVTLALGGFIAFPQYAYVRAGHLSAPFSFYPGFLVHENLSLFSFVSYWVQNLGLHTILIPIGFIIAPRKAKLFFIPFLLLFIAGNLFQFAPVIYDNHKFFNYFMLIGSMYSAYVLYRLWSEKLSSKVLVVLISFLLIFSGIIDFFPIYNDSKMYIPDYTIEPNISWIMKNTKPESIFLNYRFMYDDASLAGRKIFFGCPTFPMTYGYDVSGRSNLLGKMLDGDNKDSLCKKLKDNKINYIEVSSEKEASMPTPSALFEKEFKPVYTAKKGDYKIYAVEQNC